MQGKHESSNTKLSAVEIRKESKNFARNAIQDQKEDFERWGKI